MRTVLTCLLAFVLSHPALAQIPPLSRDQCTRVTLLDNQTDEPVIGAEDLAYDPQDRIVYVSSFDRFALEDALDARKTVLPRGGLYAVPLDDLTSGMQDIPVTDILVPLLGQDDIRSHGIDFYESPLGARRLAAVVHRYIRGEKHWERESGLEVFGIDERGIRREAGLSDDGLCQANDVAAVSSRHFLITRDHGTCGSWMWAEDVLGLRRATVMHVSLDQEGRAERAPVPVIGGIGFANGITLDRERRRAVIAATREKALLIYDLDDILKGDAGRPVGRVSLSGGPDNLSFTAEGTVLAAVHPSLLSMGFYRKRWFDTEAAPARLVRVDMTDASRTILYNDEVGDTFPAVTAGIEADGALIMGSVGAEGVLVCNAGSVTGTE